AIMDGGGVGRADGNVALGEGVSAPFANATGVKIIVAPPTAAGVGGVVGTPGTRAEPLVPVHLIPRWFGFAGQPVILHLGSVPRRHVRANSMDMAEEAGVEQYDGARTIMDASLQRVRVMRWTRSRD